MKRKEGISRLFEVAGERKGLLVVSGALSAVSAAFMLVPYAAVYFVLAELLKNAGDVSHADGALMTRWGWIALGGLLVGFLFLHGGIMASHVAAFRILYGL